MQENEIYEDVIDQINRKLALRQVMDTASDAIERSRLGAGSEIGSIQSRSIAAASYRTPSSIGAESQQKSACTDNSRQSSLIALSHKVRQQA